MLFRAFLPNKHVYFIEDLLVILQLVIISCPPNLILILNSGLILTPWLEMTILTAESSGYFALNSLYAIF
jgi:hypothetical protein